MKTKTIMDEDQLSRPRRCRERESRIYISRELLARIEATFDPRDVANFVPLDQIVFDVETQQWVVQNEKD